MNIGKNIKQLREEKNLTQEKLAELSGLEQSYVGQAERGEKNITLNSLMKLTNAMNVSISEFTMELEGAVEEKKKTTHIRIDPLFAGCKFVNEEWIEK